MQSFRNIASRHAIPISILTTTNAGEFLQKVFAPLISNDRTIFILLLPRFQPPTHGDTETCSSLQDSKGWHRYPPLAKTDVERKLIIVRLFNYYITLASRYTVFLGLPWKKARENVIISAVAPHSHAADARPYTTGTAVEVTRNPLSNRI